MNIFGLSITKIKPEVKKAEAVYYDDCEFDFDRINVFSIERINDQTQLNFFYDRLDGESKITSSWYFQCSLKRHKKLIKQFKKSKDIS